MVVREVVVAEQAGEIQLPQTAVLEARGAMGETVRWLNSAVVAGVE